MHSHWYRCKGQEEQPKHTVQAGDGVYCTSLNQYNGRKNVFFFCSSARNIKTYSVFLWGSRGSVFKFEEKWWCHNDVIRVWVVSAKGLGLCGLKGRIKVDDKLHDGNCRILESNIKSHGKMSCIPNFSIQRHIEQQCCTKDSFRWPCLLLENITTDFIIQILLWIISSLRNTSSTELEVSLWKAEWRFAVIRSSF